jgi:hypothetical protein
MDHDESERQHDAAGGADEFARAALNEAAAILLTQASVCLGLAAKSREF